MSFFSPAKYVGCASPTTSHSTVLRSHTRRITVTAKDTTAETSAVTRICPKSICPKTMQKSVVAFLGVWNIVQYLAKEGTK